MSVVEGIKFILSQHGFDATVSMRDGFSIDLSSKRKFAPDAADLKPDVFEAFLGSVPINDELGGIANRRKTLRNPDMTKWQDDQRAAIIFRKAEIEKEQAK